jgi:hypothetical protein
MGLLAGGEELEESAVCVWQPAADNTNVAQKAIVRFITCSPLLDFSFRNDRPDGSPV